MADTGRSTVVLRYRDGHTLRCFLTKDFTPSDHSIEAESEEGETVRVEVDQLKAVFFLKDPLRREVELQLGQPSTSAPEGGAPARVEFFDGEIIHGRMSSYSVDDKGFFLYPTSLESNNERMFVVAQALRTLSIEG
jgi:hypothetical protein